MARRTISLFIGILLALLLAPTSRVLAYSVETHAFLTSTVFDFYNRFAVDGKKLPEELRNFFIDGARREDDVPRWMNHFYDPVYNRGLTDSVLGTWETSKEWARDEENQNKPTYKVPATIASILTAIQRRSIDAISSETNFTWQQAIRYWLKGEKEKAAFMLGHVIHLIEDAAVPEHTRNDPHPGDSPYEDWTEQFTITNPDVSLQSSLAGVGLINADDLSSYFDRLATFTNNGFYSKDTVGVQSGYQQPQPDFEAIEGDYVFGFKNSEGGDSYRLFLREKKGIFDSVVSNSNGISLLLEKAGGDKVFRDYWLRLSTRAVQYSAGVIDLFFREVARAEQDPSFLGEEPKSMLASALDVVQSFFTSAANTVTNAASDVATFAQNVVSRIQNEPESVGEIVAETSEQIAQILAGNPTDGIVIDTEEERAQLKELQNQLDDISDQIDDLAHQVDVVTGKGGVRENGDIVDGPGDVNISSDKNVSVPSASGSGGGGIVANPPNLIITEIFYNASGTDDGREWIEVRNDGASAASLDDVRFFEGGTNHWLTFTRGDALLSPGAYAVIADDADQFLLNYPAFSGGLFDSSFSLSNSGEVLALTFDGSTFHSVTYSSSTGAYGDGDSLQLITGNWQASAPTPGAVNVVTSSDGSDASGDEGSATSTATSSPPTSGFGARHVVISEIQVSGADAGDEFIELYNPTDAVVSLSGWSLQYVGGAVETVSSSTVSKKNFLATSTIAAKSFYLIGRGLNDIGEDGYRGDVTADMTQRTFSLSGVSTGARVFLVSTTTPVESDNDLSILDVLDYTSTTVHDAGESLERRAWSDSLCHSAIPGGSGEFLGNGCDTGVFASDFELRAFSRPQNAQSFMEPRAAPSGIAQLETATSLATYERDSVSVNFAWQPSTDFQSTTSTVTYAITNASTSAPIWNGTSTSALHSLSEVGRSYSYIVQAFDRDGLGSATSSAVIGAPSFFNALYFYRDPRASSTDYFADLYYPSYPFIPDRYSSGDYWHLVVFYLNRAAPGSTSTHFRDAEPIPETLAGGIVPVKFRDCSGQPDEMNIQVRLPDIGTQCIPSGPTNDDVAFSLLEDPHVRMVLASSSDEVTFTGSDYLTAAFYDYSTPFWAYGGGRMFSLVATDVTRYYFSTSSPPFRAPELPDSLTAEFDSASSRLIVRWATSTDVDTLDNLITYEIAFSTSSIPAESEWQSAGPQPHADVDDQTFISHRYLRHVVPGDAWAISVRAEDEFGVTSTERTVAWQYPPAVETFSQAARTGWSDVWGQKNSGHPSYPNRASLQSVIPASSLTFDVAAVSVWEEVIGRNALTTLRLGVFNDDGLNKPLLTSKLGEATILQLGNISTSTDLAFTFSSPLMLATSTKYWFALDVGSVSDSGAYFDNQWRNAIATGDSIPNGEAGLGAATECTNNDYCGTIVPSPSADADWYLKLYLRQ